MCVRVTWCVSATSRVQLIIVQYNMDTLGRTPPPWLEAADGGQEITVRELPLREQIDVPVREQLIVELYSK